MPWRTRGTRFVLERSMEDLSRMMRLGSAFISRGKNNTCVMEVKAQKVHKKKTEEMDVNANDEADKDEEMAKEVEDGKEGEVVFRRRMLS